MVILIRTHLHSHTETDHLSWVLLKEPGQVHTSFQEQPACPPLNG